MSVQRRGRCSVSCFDLARPLLFSAAFFWFHSVSVQRRDRCSVSYFDPSQDPFCFPLLSSGYTVYLSKDVTGALLPTPLTPLLTPFPPPSLYLVTSFANRLERLLSLLPLFCWVLSPSVTGLSVQRRGRYSSPSQSYLELPVIPLTHQPSPCEKTKPECLSTSRLNRLLQKVSVHLD